MNLKSCLSRCKKGSGVPMKEAKYSLILIVLSLWQNNNFCALAPAGIPNPQQVLQQAQELKAQEEKKQQEASKKGVAEKVTQEQLAAQKAEIEKATQAKMIEEKKIAAQKKEEAQRAQEEQKKKMEQEKLVKEAQEKAVAAPLAPAVLKPVAVEAKELEPIVEQPLGTIDTVNIEEGGNWLLKRKALEDTIDAIEKSNGVFTQILESRMNYKIKQNQLDSEYDKFVSEVGFDIGDAQKLLGDLTERVNQERAIQGDLTEQERELLAVITEKQTELASLQESLQTIGQIEKKIIDVMTTIDNQIQISNTYQNQAWKNFQEIKQVLSDERAEELYYNTDGIYKSLQEIYTYLKGTLASYFNEQIQAMREEMTKIKASVTSLQQKGIDLKAEFEKLEQQDLEIEQKRIKEQVEQDVEQKLQEIIEREKKQQSRGWWSFVMKSFGQFFSAINNLFSTVWNKITSLWRKPTQPTIQEVTVPQEMPPATEPVTPEQPVAT